MNFFSRIGQSISRFMYGRYGNDSLNQFLITLWLVEAVLNLFLHSLILYVIGIILCIVVFYRMLSKNIVKRQRENASWYRFSSKWKGKFRHLTVRIRDRKTTRFFKCPHCNAPIRMPRKIGKFNIRCQRCGKQFVKEFKK